MKGAKLPYPDPYQRADRGKVYYFSFTDPRTGKLRQRSTKCERRSDAVKAIKKFIDSLEETSSAEQALSFAEYAEPFFHDGKCPRQARLQDERKSYGARHMQDLRDGITYVIGRPADGRKQARKALPFASLLLGKIARSDVYALRRALSKRPGGRAGQTALKAVKTVLSEARILGHLDDDPAAGVGLYKRPEVGSDEPGAERERSAFTREEMRTLWTHRVELAKGGRAGQGFGRWTDDPRGPVVLAMLLGLGVRVAELRALRWCDVDLDQGQFSILRGFKGTAASAEIGKPKWGKVRRNLVLPSCVRADLIAYRDALKAISAALVQPDNAVIPDPNGKPVGGTFIAKIWARMKERAEDLPEDERIDFSQRWLTPHSCRHSLNTWLLLNNAPPLQVQTYLGWESDAGKALAEMQQHYGHFELAGTREVAKIVDVILQGDEKRSHLKVVGGKDEQ